MYFGNVLKFANCAICDIVKPIPVCIIFMVIWQSVTCSGGDTTDDDSSKFAVFTHEKCEKNTLSSNQYTTYYPADDFFDDGVFELLVRFKGIADGHVILTANTSSAEPLYAIKFGSYNNRFSEIRRSRPNKVETRVSTPSIMSDLQFRGFLIRYDSNNGHISVFGEGSDVALIHFEDTNEPLNVRYFSFATWHNRVVQVAFHCVPKDTHSLARDPHLRGRETLNATKVDDLDMFLLSDEASSFLSSPALQR